MVGSNATRGVIAAAGTALALSGVAPAPARADNHQNVATSANDDLLYIRGFGGYTGAGVTIGLHEAGNHIPNYYGNQVLEPNSLLPWGNVMLPTARFFVLPQGGKLGPADTVGNHASTVAGCIVGNHPTEYGIARTSNILAGGFDIPRVGNLEENLRAGEARAALMTQSMVVANARIINQSWGIPQAFVNPLVIDPPFFKPFNNGNGINSRFTDWISRTKPAGQPGDVLIVTAGNEGSQPGEATDWGSASDAYNVLNVGATGHYNAAGLLLYDTASTYNRPNETADRSRRTGLGRMNTHMVAPGGDPSGNIGRRGTIANPGTPVGSQFLGISGGQVEYQGLYPEREYRGDPLFLKGYWESDDRAAFLGLFGTGFTSSNGIMWDTDPQGPFAPARNNPGFGLRKFIPQYTLSNADAYQVKGLGGTSFAAPLVSGAAACLVQYGTQNNESVDHRVLKAVLMNGAGKIQSDDGGPLYALFRGPGGFLYQRTWERVLPASLGATKPDRIRGGNMPIQIGLDYDLGTGELDLLSSFINYSAGEWGPGGVPDTGYSLSTLTPRAIDGYTFVTYGGEFRATLVWDRTITLSDVDADGQWGFDDDNANNALDPGEAWESLDIGEFVDLDLELYRLDPRLGRVLVDFSTSDIDNTEHLWQVSLAPGVYMLQVLNQGNIPQEYALAWMVPSPGAAGLLGISGGLMATRRRRS